MEHNIDKQFKRQLDQRSIKPNATSWDRLDAMLEVADSQKPAKKRYWLAIAASVIGLLGIGIAVMLSFPTTTENQMVLETKTETKVQNETVSPENIGAPVMIVENSTTPNSAVSEKSSKESSKKPSQTQGVKVKKVEITTPANTKNTTQENTKELIANAPQSNPAKDKTVEQQAHPTNVVTNPEPVKIAAVEKEQPVSKPKKFTLKVDPAKLLANADEDPRTLMQRMYTVASNTGQTVAGILSTRNVEHK